MRSTTQVEIDGVSLILTNLEKVLYPETGFTKGDVIQYYLHIAPAILPHLKDRPLTMKRFPDGVRGEYFYEKQCPEFHPEWVPISSIHGAGKHHDVDYCMVNSAAALAWVANLASLELHTLLSRHPDPDTPTMMVFDLDPGEPATLLDAARVALWLKDALEALGLESFAKGSGGKGVHVYVPLNSTTTFDQTKAFARSIAEVLERRRPAEITSNIRKAERSGKVLVDWSQNDRHKTTVCAYSLRAHERPTVSAPVTWQELHQAVERADAANLVFGPAEVMRRVENPPSPGPRVAGMGDLFAAVLSKKQRLPETSPDA